MAERRQIRVPTELAEAIVAAGPGGHAERYVPRPYWLVAALRVLAPGLVRRALLRGGGASAPATAGDRAP